MSLRPEAVDRLVAAIEAEGYEVLFADYIENPRQPGILGLYGGITDRPLRLVRIRTKGRTDAQIVSTLEHELRHVTEPDWDCGNRDVFGRGGPAG